jgi:hypothetical protein
MPTISKPKAYNPRHPERTLLYQRHGTRKSLMKSAIWFTLRYSPERGSTK